MKLKVKISGVKSANKIDSYWQDSDFVELLTRFDFPDAHQVLENELQEMLFMAMTDFEPDEAAKIVLIYKLGERLKASQIEALSHEMIEDKVAEEYPNPSLHYDLFNINQLLYSAFEGVFPNTEVSLIDIILESQEELNVSKEVLAKSLKDALKENCILKRLYADQLEGKAPFTDLGHFIWEYERKEDGSYRLITSKYWIEKEDFINFEYHTEVRLDEEDADTG